MEKREKIKNLRDLLRPAIENQSAFLVDVSLRGDAQRDLIEVFCETEKGITIEECARISREILPLIDASKIASANFRLEVSSPGIGVPLKDKRQFKRNVGKLMSVKYHIPTGSASELSNSSPNELEVKQIEGDMVDMTEEELTIATPSGPVMIDFDSIEEAVVKIRW